MVVLKYKDKELSLFDFEKAEATRREVIDKLNEILGLEALPSNRKMLEQCIRKPELFTYKHRTFLRDVAILELDSKSLSDRQSSYLHSLYLVASKS